MSQFGNPVHKLGMIAMIVAVSLALTACGTADQPEPTPAPSPTSIVPTATPMPPGVLGNVVWTTEIDEKTNEPADELETVDRNAETVYAVIQIEDMAGGTIITANWSVNGQPLETFTANVTVDQQEATGYVEFHLTRTGELYWPEGTLEVAITTNTGLETSGSIEIV